MRILFVRPEPSPDTIGLQHLMVVEPLELEIMATLVQGKHQVLIADMILEKRNLQYFVESFKPEVMCITGYITHIPVIISYCTEAKIKNPLIQTIVGGVHIEKFPEDIEHENVDYRVVRNATRTFPQLIDFLSGESEFPSGVLKKYTKLDETLLPDYDFYTVVPDRTLTSIYRQRYFYVFHNKVALMKGSFGCPYQCNFCFCRKITGYKYFARPVNELVDELEGISEKEVYLVDDDFLVSTERVKEFLWLVKERNIKKKYLVYGRADFIGKNPELIKEFKKAGLRTVIVGLESFDDIELTGFNKQTDSNINRLAMNVLNKYGVNCYAGVILSPSWSAADFKKAGDIMLSLGIMFVNLQPLTPLKGIDINFNESDLVISREEYAKWDLAHVTIRPEHMPVAEYYRQVLKLYLRILYHPANIIKMLKYPIKMQFRMVKGLRKVMKQYKERIMQAEEYDITESQRINSQVKEEEVTLNGN
jgi:hopanoid C-3 methylase